MNMLGIPPDGFPPVGSGSTEESVENDWEINTGSWTFATRLKILVVMDGDITASKSEKVFGLGQVLETLRDRSVAWWLQFDVDEAYRVGVTQWTTEHPLFKYKVYLGFRFTTQPDFELDAYDQVWFFGHNPRGSGEQPDDVIDDAEFFPLEDAELKLLAEWMDRRGGVFATGDHGILGASMCSRIPRVRTMRKWKHDQDVPPKYGEERHQTLVPVPNLNDFEEEQDQFPQPIEPVYHQVGVGPAVFANLAPHPILCAPTGVIDLFPDHMHEGEVVDDGDVELNKPLDIPGYNRQEYPPFDLKVLPLAAADSIVLAGPRPEVIAYGRTRNPEVASSERFPLIGVYDGDGASIGRVVVDSTWHHWFSYNVAGLKKHNPVVYKKLQAYYRNVALWLATPAQRISMLYSATWGVITGLSPMAFSRGMDSWLVGEQVTDVFTRHASQCILHELVAASLSEDAAMTTSIPPDLPPGQPSWSFLPQEIVNRAIVGGIGGALLDPAMDYMDAHSRGERPLLNVDQIRRLAYQGSEEGYKMLLDSLERAKAEIEDIETSLANGFQSPPLEAIEIPVETRQVRIVAERLQFPDSTDPALMEAKIAFTLRVRIDGNIMAYETLDSVEIPSFGPQGAVLELGLVVLETAVQSGQVLAIEVLAGSWAIEKVGHEPMRFLDRLPGDPSDWIGEHQPGRRQPWRLWYRVEDVGDALH